MRSKQLCQLTERLKPGLPGLRVSEAVGGPDEGNPGQSGGLQVPLGVAHIGGAGNSVPLHYQAYGLPLTQPGFAEAGMVPDEAPQLSLFQQQLNVALLAIADDKQPMAAGERLQSLLLAVSERNG